MWAAWHGHADVVRVLLDGGADAEASSEGSTALTAAAANGHAGTIRVRRPAPVCARRSSLTPLTMVAFSECVAAVGRRLRGAAAPMALQTWLAPPPRGCCAVTTRRG